MATRDVDRGRPRTRSTTARLLVPAVLGSLLVVTGLGAGPASAAVPGLVQVTTTTPSDSTSPKFVTATCPAGKVLIGTGASVVPSRDQVVLERIVPQAAAVRVGAYEDETGFAGSWALLAHAICSDPLPGLEIVAAASPADSASPKSITATCPVGKRPLGTGGMAGASSQVRMELMAPAGGAVVVRGYEDETGFAGNWSLQSFAICANPLPGQEVVTASTATDSVSPKVVTANCSAGKRVVGTGSAALGQASLGQVIPVAMTPGAAAVTVRAYEDETGYAVNWTLTAYAICAIP